MGYGAESHESLVQHMSSQIGGKPLAAYIVIVGPQQYGLFDGFLIPLVSFP